MKSYQPRLFLTAVVIKEPKMQMNVCIIHCGHYVLRYIYIFIKCIVNKFIKYILQTKFVSLSTLQCAVTKAISIFNFGESAFADLSNRNLKFTTVSSESKAIDAKRLSDAKRTRIKRTDNIIKATSAYGAGCAAL